MGNEDDARPVYSPADLAARWGCSADMVRQVIRSDQLEAFRVGSKLLRVRAEAVADYEARKAAKGKAKAPVDLTPEERAAARSRNVLTRFAVDLVVDRERRRRERLGRD